MKIYKSIFLLIVFLSVTSISTASPKFADAKNMGEVDEKILDEVSGLAASMDNPGVLWTHNDNGSDRRIYAINTSCRILAEYKLKIDDSKDWEDIAVGPGPEEGRSYIYVGDIGDNNGTYNKRSIYRFEEPEVDPDQKYAEFEIKEKHIDIIKFKYPDGSRDAEAMMLDPLTKDLYVISKREDNVGVYLIKYPQSTEETITMEHVATLPYGNEGFSGSGVTAGDISHDGREIIIKQYFQVYYYYRAEGETVASALSKDFAILPYLPEPQGEAICWAYDGSGYYTLSERGSSILQRTPVLYFYQRLTDSKKKARSKKN
ncbi:MAG: hypothetical protein PF588_08905 [Candidatus Kapabacteria bacterium]|jgi:hypothetical protein|nr:hypothetical protein [Candidatus Kapabacteria bacterium]